MIAVENLSVVFNAGTPLERRALRGVSLALADGEFVCVIGSNGAGKSTLLGAIAGDVSAASGRILVAGQDVTRQPAEARAQHVARVFQDPLAGSCGNLSIAENLALAAGRGSRRGFGNALRRERAEMLHARIKELALGLEDRLDQPMGSLSGGQRQALSLVMATLAPSSVLLLDEHTAALDPRNADFVLDLTRTLAARFGLTVLMVTHSMRQALDLGTRTIMLHEGQILLDVSGEHRSKLTVEDLIDAFRKARGEELAEDRLLTS
ncbi:MULTISPECIES: ABC transporter ATP-binding protein [Chelatococcus]|uniref:Putative ABC transport system ATP-binding protein n=1 Tax=Chelatococcus caeni TaxID=1348468 RepID=A0A840C6V4_9HYPH|nr:MULTISPECIES: ABC transporter ATP-binding protein [Chelatococcus]ALA16516.1 ABC transporter ATP-binding protein [Chelatococcus sp. CO-6]MBB4018107.1 putative ABC transport system ATP-binding protein [Chelatococcus caeni]